MIKARCRSFAFFFLVRRKINGKIKGKNSFTDCKRIKTRTCGSVNTKDERWCITCTRNVDSVSTYGLPNNPISGARYQGVNLLRLLIASAVGKYEDSRWMTLKQANKQGYRIKKGAKSVLLEKWVWSKIVEEENENGELEKKIVKLRNPYVNFLEFLMQSRLMESGQFLK